MTLNLRKEESRWFLRVLFLCLGLFALTVGCAPKNRSESAPQSTPSLPSPQLHLGSAKIAKLDSTTASLVAIRQSQILSYYASLSPSDLSDQLSFVKSLDDRSLAIKPTDSGFEVSIDERNEQHQAIPLVFNLEPVDQRSFAAYLNGYMAEFVCLDASEFCTLEKDAFLVIKKLRPGAQPILGITYFHTHSKGKILNSVSPVEVSVRDLIDLDRNTVITLVAYSSNDNVTSLKLVSEETDEIPFLKHALGKLGNDVSEVVASEELKISEIQQNEKAIKVVSSKPAGSETTAGRNLAEDAQFEQIPSRASNDSKESLTETTITLDRERIEIK